MVKPRIEAETISTRRSGSQPRRVTGLSLFHLARGRTTWSVDGRSFELLEGQTLLVLPGCVFSGVESSEAVPIRVDRIRLASGELTSSGLANQLSLNRQEAKKIVETLKANGPCSVKLTLPLRSLFSETVRCVEAGTELEAIHANACFLNLLTGMCLLLQGEGASEANRSTDAEKRVVQFLRELEARCDEPWMLEQMADQTGLKRSRFGILCRSLTGESPGTYLNRLRIRKSRRLLQETERTVTDIAFDCGFSSSQYFAKIFRQFQGHEPTHYRRMSREQREGKGIHYLKGDTARTVAFADREVGSGDFSIECVLMLDRLGGTAASLEFGGDRFGFDGREGRLFLEGETFGDIQHFQRSGSVIREGNPFRLRLERRGGALSGKIDGRKVFEIQDDPERLVGKIGLRPLRNGIRVESFRINDESAVLK